MGIQVVAEVVPHAVDGPLRPPEVVLVLPLVPDEGRVQGLQLGIELLEPALQALQAPAQLALVSAPRAHRPAPRSRGSRAIASPLGVSFQRTSPSPICARAPAPARRSTSSQNVPSSTCPASVKNRASIRL